MIFILYIPFRCGVLSSSLCILCLLNCSLVEIWPNCFKPFLHCFSPFVIMTCVVQLGRSNMLPALSLTKGGQWSVNILSDWNQQQLQSAIVYCVCRFCVLCSCCSPLPVLWACFVIVEAFFYFFIYALYKLTAGVKLIKNK